MGYIHLTIFVFFLSFSEEQTAVLTEVELSIFPITFFFPLSAPFNDKHDQTFLGLGSFIDGIFVCPFTAVTSSLEESNEEIILRVSGSEGPELKF